MVQLCHSNDFTSLALWPSFVDSLLFSFLPYFYLSACNITLSIDTWCNEDTWALCTGLGTMYTGIASHEHNSTLSSTAYAPVSL
jgi:hypothetical protein